jgi:TetR/AcrR family transcriptional repressor of mexJK operon
MQTIQRNSQRRRPSSQTASAIIAAATRLFLSQGYSQTSLEQVAKQAGVTKPTVYSHFGSKEALLRKVTQKNTDQRIAAMSNELQPTANLRRDLIRFGDAILATVLSSESRAWHRFAGAEALDHPEVGEAFYAAGPARVIELLSGYLTTQKRLGRVVAANPGRAAEQLLGLLLGLELLRSRIGQPVKSPSALRRHCRDCVELFLNTYGADQR